MLSGFFGGNVVFALLAALLWGGGDFSGGMCVKRAGGSLTAALRVVLLSHVTSFLVLLVAAGLRGDPFPHGALLAWGLTAGVAGGLALTAFYVALSRGAMGASAAVSGLMAAAIPAVVSIALDGSPGIRPLLGFSVAAVAIWLIAAGPSDSTTETQSSTMPLAIAAGIGFGVYFVALKYAGPAGVIWPMATARIGSITTCSLLLIALPLRARNPGWPIHDSPTVMSGGPTHPIRFDRLVILWSLSTALLDTSGNLLFVAATRLGRLDVAAVLASLYPASTILLAAATQGERPTRRQALGMVTAVVAVVLIAL